MHYACITNVSDGSSCVLAELNVASDDYLSFTSTLGVGVNKTVVVNVIDAGVIGYFSQVSGPLFFNYSGPDITGLLNSPVLMTDGFSKSLQPQQPAVIQVCLFGVCGEVSAFRVGQIYSHER